MKKVAIIGTGIMGSGIALNFLKHGYTVYVWNRNKDKLAALVKSGAIAVDTPKQGAQIADIIFEVTANDESSRSVWTAEDGILAGATTEKIFFVNATISVPWVDELGRICEEKGLTFFDMPMTGGRSGAESGNLILLAGGEETKLPEVKPDLEAISQRVIYFGKAGSGIRFKLILNLLQSIHIAGLGEVLKMAQQAGMHMETVGDTLAERPGGLATGFTWRDYQHPPESANFSVQWIEKDLKYAKEFADTLQTPLLDDVLAKYQEAMQKGMGSNDWTIITKF